MKEEGSSATDCVTDVTDVSPRQEVRGKKSEARRKKEEVEIFTLFPSFHLPLSPSPLPP
ncbi:MAG: hypothetical protein HC941_21105, partial [Microcoleus sp. SU_5_3]|nr:hypothetical protein [Microcoleus sp. SU_5_3]